MSGAQPIRSGRLRPNSHQIANITDQFRRLLNALADPRGTTLDPYLVARQLEAIRQDRVSIAPAREPEIVLNEWDDWSNLAGVPIEALGLRKSIVDKLRTARISTVGLITLHSRDGLTVSHARLGPKLVDLLIERLAAHNLQLASDNTRLPIEFITGSFHQLFPGWVRADQARFAAALGLVVLGDLARLTRAQIAKAPIETYKLSSPDVDRQMSSDRPAYVQLVVNGLNQLMMYYSIDSAIA